MRAALQQNGGALDKKSGDQTNANLVQVQKAIGEGAQRRPLRQPRRQRTSRASRSSCRAVRLPDEVQTAVNEAQAQFAEVNKASADLQKARIRKQVNDTLGRSYENCPACAQIDALKSIPANVNAISLGGGGSIALNGNKK